MKAQRIPVWLVCGWLGSGKTTLIRSWLRDPGLADAALIVNEVGEVGFDDRLLSASVDSAALLAGTCVCCTGLPGLEQALSDLFWDRLHRRRPAFGSVLIETTGLADPGPIVEAFERVPLLRERYRLAGVVVTASASAGLALLGSEPQAGEQLAHADAIVVTKSDRSDGARLAEALRARHPRAAIACSSQASLGWPQVQAMLAKRRSVAAAAAHDDHHRHHHEHEHEHHDHAASTSFLPLPQALSSEELQAQVQRLWGTGLLRLKGVVRLDDGRLLSVQWSSGDDEAVVAAFDGAPPVLGLTSIRRQ